MSRHSSLAALCAAMMTAGVVAPATAQAHKQSLLTGNIDNSKTVAVRGNVRPEVTAENDRGARIDSAPLTGMQLVLHRTPENQAAFSAYVTGLTQPHAANYHQWLSNAQVGEQFGPTQADVAKVSQWLTDQGFVVHGATPDRTSIEFDGNVGLVKKAFHTSIHDLSVNGANHFANVTDPELPEALTPVVSGVASLSDFSPKPQSHKKIDASERAQGLGGNGYNYLSAADISTIYNFNPVFAAGITGKGVSIALIEDTDLYSAGDWQTFRKVFGLARAYPYGTLSQVHPAGSTTCTAPGVNGDDGEAAIDVEWASAAAPNATILNAACADTNTNFGGFIALSNLLQSANPPKVVSISYGEPESSMGATYNAYTANLYATAAAEGVSLFVSSGDSGSASADQNKTVATHGIEVSGFASTPYNVAVGGTDFGFTPYGIPGTYFNSINLTNYRTALSYIPEIPWDNSCASNAVSTYVNRPQVGPTSYCNATTGLHTTAAGSGGPSSCAFGVPANRNVANGTCAGYPKPAWQSLVGVPSDGVRDIPDVSLFAANGLWGSYYAVCYSDPADGETPCTNDPSTWAGFGGTSISSPIWAGIQALVNQATGQSWGNANPVLYSLANSAYGSAGNSGCNSSLGQGVASNCVFYDLTQGDNTVNCTGSYNCYINGGTYGAISQSKTSFVSAFSTGTGYDLASGIGSTNVNNLVGAWKNYSQSQ